MLPDNDIHIVTIFCKQLMCILLLKNNISIIFLHIPTHNMWMISGLAPSANKPSLEAMTNQFTDVCRHTWMTKAQMLTSGIT